MQGGEGEGEGDSMMRSSGGAMGGGGGVYGRPGQGVGRPGGRKGLLFVVAAVVAIALFALPSLTGGGKRLRGSNVDSRLAEDKGPFAPDTWDILLIADLDKKSKVEDSGGKKFRSVLQAGTLTRTPSVPGEGSFSVSWGEATDLFSGHNEAGRGMELSELIKYRGALLAVDDRTGIVFEIIEGDDGRHMAPRYIVPEGDGNTDKGMKLEWVTVKDGRLVMGSIGKEFTDRSGAITGYNNNWVDFIDPHGEVTHEDWTQKYEKLRAEAGASFPGYMIHESAAWSDALHKWVFLPRRISDEAYDDMKDEKMGSNTILIADEDFRNVDVRHAGTKKPTHGFSSFKFVPGTGDKVVVALKSEENEDAGTQNAFLTVFTLDGEVLLDEVEVPGALKFEGVEIMPIPAARIDDGGKRRRDRR